MVRDLHPLLNLIGLFATADRLNRAHAKYGSPVQVSGGMTLLSAFWFASQPRYLQRRLNKLADAIAASSTAPAAAPSYAPPATA